MRSRILLLSLSPVLLLCGNAGAQLLPADDFFHAGAQSYLTNNIPGALERVTNGLAVYPDDAKLKKLYELLKQQQQSQSQSQQQQQQQQDQQSKADQQKKQDEQKQEQKKQEEQQKQQQQDQEQGKDNEDQKQDKQPQQPGEMSPDQAKQMLDSQKNDEALLPVSRSEKPRNENKPIKDW